MAAEHLLSRRAFLRLSGLTAIGSTLLACGVGVPQAPPAVEAAVADPNHALERLIEGNQRYMMGKSTDLNESAGRRAEVAQGQKPFATIFSCVDSRVPPELVFDRGLGDLFVIRTAGHVVDDAALGSMQFGVAELAIPLLVVMGHEKCGAIAATIEAVEKKERAPGQIERLVEGITPAVEKVMGQPGDLLDNAIRAHVERTVDYLKTAPILTEALSTGKLKVVGARYDLDSGAVDITVP